MSGATDAKGIDMDYGKSGAPKLSKNKPRHKEHNAKGTEKNPFSQKPSKADLLARMKAAASKEEKG